MFLFLCQHFRLFDQQRYRHKAFKQYAIHHKKVINRYNKPLVYKHLPNKNHDYASAADATVLQLKCVLKNTHQE